MQIDEKADAWLEDERTSTLYQVIGSLAEAAGVFDDPHVIRALDLAAYGKTQDGGDVLPFCPAYESAKQKGEAEGWRPIESAPHGEDVLVGWWTQDGMGGSDWSTEIGPASHGWRRGSISNMSRHSHATHWRPLPEPPTMLSAGGEG